jgi:hypothetical protein
MPRRNTRTTRVAPEQSTGPAKDYPDPEQLAQENDISLSQETEIRDAFGLFAVKHSQFEDAPEGVIKVDDVRRCMM